MDFILIDEEKHIREQNHIPKMHFLAEHLYAWQIPIIRLSQPLYAGRMSPLDKNCLYGKTSVLHTNKQTNPQFPSGKQNQNP